MTTSQSTVAWEQMLRHLMPDYDNVMAELQKGPKITANTIKKGRLWEVRIMEEEDPIVYFQTIASTLEDKIQWTTQQLGNWTNVTRMSYDRWYFRYKKDADKFVMLFNLKWL